MHNTEEELYKKFKNEKMILGIRDTDLKFKYTTSYNWFVTVYALIIIQPAWFASKFLSVDELMQKGVFIALIFINALFIFLSIYAFLKGQYKLYFEDNNIIIKNGIGKKSIIDIGEPTRCYMRYRRKKIRTRHHSYYHTFYEFCIEQKDIKPVKISSSFFSSKDLCMLLDNFTYKEKNECNEQEWKSSLSEKESKIIDYIDYLKIPKKIIGVKDIKKNMNIVNGFDYKKHFIICLIFFLIFATLYYINESIKIFKTLTIIWGVYDFILFSSYLEHLELGGYYLKIRYLADNRIKINWHYLKYKQCYSTIHIERIQVPASDDKYNYYLIISNDNKSKSIKLGYNMLEKVEEFIDNLIFEK